MLIRGRSWLGKGAFSVRSPLWLKLGILTMVQACMFGGAPMDYWAGSMKLECQRQVVQTFGAR